MRRYRVLQIAEAANPEWASVPLEGWSLSRALAELTDAHLVTHVRNSEAIARAGLVEGGDFTAIDNEYLASPIYRFANLVRGGEGKGWTTIMAFSSLAYYSFEREVWRKFGERICAGEFDLVHRITPISPTSQSLLAKRLAHKNVPFIIGPLNGGVPWPRHFVDRQHAEKEWFSHVRNLYKLLPGYRSTRRYSAALIAGSKHTLGEIPAWAREKSVYIPENGVDMSRFPNPRSHSASLPLKAAFLGRLVPYKGADILLEAAKDFLRAGQLELHIIGDGPQRSMLESMVTDLQIGAQVRFHGWIPHTEVQAKLRVCDFLALPSVREFGGAVVVESMALGVMPIVANYAGPAELVDDTTGVRVDFTDKQSLIQNLRQAIGFATRFPEILDRFGAAGRERVLESFTWQAKAGQIVRVYDAVLNGRKQLSSLSYQQTPIKAPLSGGG